jgi:hypothetical protein
VRTPAEAIDFLHYHPCWPVERFAVKNGEWVRSEVPSPKAHEPTEQPATIELRRRLTTMNEALLARGVVGGEVHGDPPGESWFEVADRINAKQLAALGKIRRRRKRLGRPARRLGYEARQSLGSVQG